MKRRCSRPSQPGAMALTAEESSAISCAMDFLLHCDRFTCDASKFDLSDARAAAWSADDGKLTCKRREIRAVAAAIDLSLHCLESDPAAVDQVAGVYPDLIPDLRESAPVLASFRPRLAAYAAKLAQKR